MNKVMQEINERLAKAEEEQKELLSSLEGTALYQNYLRVSELVKELKEVNAKLSPPQSAWQCGGGGGGVTGVLSHATYHGGIAKAGEIYNNSLAQMAYNSANGLNKK